MAHAEEQYDLPEEVVYDSQQEDDQWLESQSSIQAAIPVNGTPRRSQLLKVYGRSKVFLNYTYLSDRDPTDKSRVGYFREVMEL